jgi:Fe-S-cluster-containing hydrogenase components 1
VLIDPAKAKGQREIMDACPYHAIYWNDALNIPQKCTGCAHLLDGDHPISVPRCVDNCHVDVITFGEEADLDLEGTEVLHPEYGTKPRVFYRGLPKKFIAGTVFDPDAEEIIEGATVTATGDAGTFTATTDSWGDFWLRDLPDAEWTVTIEHGGKKKSVAVSTVSEDQGLGDVALS